MNRSHIRAFDIAGIIVAAATEPEAIDFAREECEIDDDDLVADPVELGRVILREEGCPETMTIQDAINESFAFPCYLAHTEL